MKRRRLVGKQPARASAPEAVAGSDDSFVAGAAETERTTATAANTNADPPEDVKNLQILGALLLRRTVSVKDVLVAKTPWHNTNGAVPLMLKPGQVRSSD